jgi:HlyD family secretion protein
MYFTRSSSTTQTTTSVSTVTKQSIVTTISAAGKVTFASEQELKFNQKGTVTRVNFSQGDTVREGDIIAQLDESSIQQDINQAALTVGASALQLQQAKDSLLVAEQKNPTDLSAAQNSVEEKQAALAQAKLDLEKQKTTEIQGLASTAQSALSTSDQLLDSMYGVLTLNTSTRPQRGIYTLPIDSHLFNDLSAQQAVQNDYVTAINIAGKMHDTYTSSLATQTNPTTLLQALSDAHDLATAIYKLGEDSYSMMQGASANTSGNGFTNSDLSTLRSTTITNRTKASDMLSTIDTAQANLQAISSKGGIPSITLNQKINAVTTAQNALLTAQNSYNLLQTQTPDSAASDGSQHVVTTSEDVSLQLKQNSLAQAATSLNKIRQTLKDYRLVAPFDGIITHIDYKVGDNLLDTGDTEYVVLQNPDEIVVTIPLDQVDVVHVTKGMKSIVTFDALPGQKFDATIDSIDPTPITQSSVVSYNVQIRLPAPKDATILSGMTTTVVIETSRKDNVLVVPNLALRLQGADQTVQKADGTSVVVKTGVTDGQYTEITTGLSEGDAVISINIPRTTGASSSANANALRGLGGLGGGIGGPPPGVGH